MSQIGLTIPAHRTLFQELCEDWQPFIDYRGFLAPRASSTLTVAGDFQSLLGRLKELKMAVVLFKRDQQGERTPDKIVLTEENDTRFWIYFLSDLFQSASENPRNPFLTENVLKAKGIYPPVEEFTELASVQLVRSFIEELMKEEKACAIALSGERILTAGRDLGSLLSFASAKLRYHLKNADALTAVARLMNSSLSEITQKMDSKDASFWKSLTQAVIQGRDDLLADRKGHLDRHFLMAAELFYSYMENQIQEVRKQKEESKERENDMKQLEQMVLQEKDGLTVPEELETNLRLLFKDKYGEGFNAFREDFFRLFTQTNQKTTLPILIPTQQGYIHRDNFYTFFIKRFVQSEKMAEEEFRLRMDRILRTKNRDGDLSFASAENLEAAIDEWLKEIDEITWEVMKKPKLLAEGMIHYGKTALKIKNIEEIKNLMDPFFKPGTMVFKRLRTIFAIDAYEVFEKAFRKLPALLQLWIRITGRYSAYRDKYIGRRSQSSQETTEGLMADRTGPRSQVLRRGSPIEASRSRQMEYRMRQKLREKKTSSTAEAEAAPAVKGSEKTADKPPVPQPIRHYSQKEQEEAWKEFRKNIHKER